MLDTLYKTDKCKYSQWLLKYKTSKVGRVQWLLAYAMVALVSFPDPPPKRKGGSGEYSTASHYGLAVAMESTKSQAFEVSSVNWRSVKM